MEAHVGGEPVGIAQPTPWKQETLGAPTYGKPRKHRLLIHQVARRRAFDHSENARPRTGVMAEQGAIDEQDSSALGGASGHEPLKLCSEALQTLDSLDPAILGSSKVGDLNGSLTTELVLGPRLVELRDAEPKALFDVERVEALAGLSTNTPCCRVAEEHWPRRVSAVREHLLRLDTVDERRSQVADIFEGLGAAGDQLHRPGVLGAGGGGCTTRSAQCGSHPAAL